MGLFKTIITHVVATKAEEALMKKIAEELPSEDKAKARKTPLFKSRRELAEAAAIYFFSVQSFYIMILMMCQIDDMSWGGFYRACAMASLVAWTMLFVGMLVYGLYRVDLLPLLFMVVPLVLVVVLIMIPIGFEYGYDIYKDFFLGIWMSPILNLVFFLLGIITIAVTLAIVIYYENGGAKKKIQTQVPSPINNEEAENGRKSLRSAIQSNAINVRFLKAKWNFATNTNVLFGYDELNSQFVFVNDQNSYTLSSKNVVYLDFEDNLYDSDNNTTNYQRLIKLYYLSKNNEELIVTLDQRSLNDMCDNKINKIKQHAIKSPMDSEEGTFRRKIRHLASSLEANCYPNRPFVNDKWFDYLKASMEKVKNNRTNGYYLFRKKLIVNDDFWGDNDLFTIIEDLSQDPPNPTSAKKEARRLCLRDFSTTLGNNIKSSVKSFFSDSE